MRDNNLYVDKENGFRRGYLIYMGILLAVILILLAVLWFKLRDYQRGIDEALLLSSNQKAEMSTEQSLSYAQKAFGEYIDSLSIDGWVNLYYQSHPDHFDREEDVYNFLNENVLSRELIKYKASDYTDVEPRFVVTADEQIIASFVMAGRDDSWEVQSSKIFVHGNETANISAPAETSVTINGYELMDEYAEVTKDAFSVEDYNEDLDNPVIMKTYLVDNLLNADSEVEAKDAYLSVDGNFYHVINEGDYTNRAKSFVQALLKFYSAGKENTDANAGAVLSHVLSGSKAAKTISAAKSGLEWVVPDYKSSYDIECSKTMKAADNCCFVDVSYKKEGEADTDEGSVYRVYFLDKGEGYKIVLFEGIK